MKRARLLPLALLLIAGAGHSQPKQNKKTPELLIEKIEVVREGEVISLDGVVRNTGAKTVEGLVLIFEFFAPGKKSLTIRDGPVESPFIEPGDASEFRLQTKAPTRAVEVTVEARDKNRRDYTVDKGGPYLLDQ